MENKHNAYIGCFVTTIKGSLNTSSNEVDYGAIFREYLWGRNGFAEFLNILGRGNYGDDIEFILIKYFVNPVEFQLPLIKDVSEYSKKEKSITLSIIINPINFFSCNEQEKRAFLKRSIFDRLLELQIFAAKKKLDLDIQRLVSDLTTALSAY